MKQLELFIDKPKVINYRLGDRVYHLKNHKLGYISQIHNGKIRVSWDDGSNNEIEQSSISLATN
jgi:hypothetical protein